MDARQHSATVDQLVKNCDKLIDGGYHCAVFYSTPTGILLTTGTPVITYNIKSLSQKIMGDPRRIQSADYMEKWSTNTKVCLPLLEKPIEKMSLIDLRTTIPQLLRAERGRKQVGWGKSNCIPVWWPLDALSFKNVNQKPKNFEGNWMNALRLVISSCLSHHGFTPETHYIGAPFISTRKLSESSSSDSTSIQTSPECSFNKSSPSKG